MLKMAARRMVPVFTSTCRSAKENLPFWGKTLPSARTSSSSRCLVLYRAPGFDCVPRKYHVLLLADGEIDLDGVHRGDGGEIPRVRRADQVADLGVGTPGDAIDRRGDLREAEAQFGLVEGRIGRLYAGFGSEIGLDGIIEFLLTDGALLGERPVPFDIQFGFPQSGPGYRQLCFGLGHCRLECTRINFEQQIAFLHRRPFLVILPGKVAGDLGADLGVHEPLGGADPFGIDGHVLLGDGHHFDLGRRWGLRQCFSPGHAWEKKHGGNQKAP